MNKLLIVTETLPDIEARLWHTLRNDFDYRVHRFIDIANDMVKVIGVDPSLCVIGGDACTDEYATRQSLVQWADERPNHRHKMANALYDRVRPLSRVGRAMCLLGIREKDLDLLLTRADQDKVAVFVWNISNERQLEISHVGQRAQKWLETAPQALQADTLHKPAVRAALTTLGLL